MTTSLFWISYAAAWVLLLALSGGLLVLFRFSLRAYRMQAPAEVGDVGTMHGPALDAMPPVLELQDLAGDPVSLGAPVGRPQLIVFAKSTCPRCRVALDLLRSVASEHSLLQTTIVCGGNGTAIENCAALVRPPMRAVADPGGEGAERWRVSQLPFGVVLDSTGAVRARGDPTSTALLTVLNRQLESHRNGAGEAADAAGAVRSVPKLAVG